MARNEPRVVVEVNRLGPWPVREEILWEACHLVLEEEGVTEGEVSVTLVDDEVIQRLNREYLGEGPTDVIAFTLHEAGDPVLGDVYIGADQAGRQASELQIPLEEELIRLAIHGTLHLMGHHHPEGEDRFESEMFLRQEELLGRLVQPGAG
jgi:probable rRNA maturation factor